MSILISWIEAHILSSKPLKTAPDKPCLDTMQNEAIQKLKDGREFMMSAIDSISAKYHNENKAG